MHMLMRMVQEQSAVAVAIIALGVNMMTSQPQAWHENLLLHSMCYVSYMSAMQLSIWLLCTWILGAAMHS